MKKISVIVPCHNSTRYLPECLASLTQQTMPIDELELIFIDDASTDGGETVAMLQSYERLYPDSIMVICLSENMRQGGARNIGMQYATGEYLLFVDSDDWIAPDACEVIYEMAQSQSADILQFGHYKFKDGENGPILLQQVHYEYDIMQLDDSIKSRQKILYEKQCTNGCWGKLYRREFVMRAGVRFAEHIVYEEALFVYPLFYLCKTYVFCPRELYCYRANEGGTMLKVTKEKDKLWHQLQTWHLLLEFMRGLPCYSKYSHMIKLDYLHCTFVEIVYFMHQRGFAPDMEDYIILRKQILEDLNLSKESIDFSQDFPFYEELLKILKGDMISRRQLEALTNQIVSHVEGNK